jgi:hypothetical protein
MHEDEDEWPVRCPRCGELTYKKIRRLKANTVLPCSGCGINLWYDLETFMEALDDSKRAVDDFSKNLSTREKRR